MLMTMTPHGDSVEVYRDKKEAEASLREWVELVTESEQVEEILSDPYNHPEWDDRFSWYLGRTNIK